MAVRESGFAQLDAPEELKAQSIESNSGGWESQLASLRDRSAA